MVVWLRWSVFMGLRDSPDLHSNVIGEHAGVFFHSALSLALIEVVGFAYGLAAALRKAL